MFSKLENFLFSKKNTPEQNIKTARRVNNEIFGSEQKALDFFELINPIIDKFDEADCNIIKQVFAPLLRGDDLFDLMRNPPDYENITPSPNVLLVFTHWQNALEKRKAEIAGGAEPLSDLLGKYYNSSKLYSLKEIREALKIDKRTLTKWLNIFFEERFDDRKRITLEEHIEIVSAFLLSNEEGKINFNKNASDYARRLAEGLMLKKSEIAVLFKSDLKTLAENLKDKFEFYNSMDKFPYSIVQDFKNKMCADY